MTQMITISECWYRWLRIPDLTLPFDKFLSLGRRLEAGVGKGGSALSQPEQPQNVVLLSLRSLEAFDRRKRVA